jgi:hypothetical protein
MEWAERRNEQLSFAQPAPLRRLMYISWRTPLLGSLAQGLCFGIGMFPVLLLLSWSLELAWWLRVVVAATFALGVYAGNRWKHNRPERFIEPDPEICDTRARPQ